MSRKDSVIKDKEESLEDFRKVFNDKRRISDEKRKAIIEDINSKNHGSLKIIAEKYKVDRRTVKKIVIEELGEEIFKQKFFRPKRLSNEVKKAIIKDIRSKNHGTLGSIAKKHRIDKKSVKYIVIKELGEIKFKKEFPAYERVSDEKKKAIAEDVNSIIHGTIRNIAKKHEVTSGTVKKIAIKELGGEKFKQEFPAPVIKRITEEKKREIIKDVNSKYYRTLGEIGKKYKLDNRTVKKIIVKELGRARFKEEFPSYKRIPYEKEKKIIEDIKTENHDTLRSIGKKHKITRKTIKKIAIEELGENRFKEEFPAYEKISDEKRKGISIDIKSESHGTLENIAKNHKVATGTVRNIAIEELGKNRFKEEFPSYERISDEKKREIIKAIKSKNHGTLESISEKYKVANGTVRIIALQELGEKEYKREFPAYIPSMKGKITHSLIKRHVTKVFDKRRKYSLDVPKIISEPKIYLNSQKSADLGFENIYNYFQKLLTNLKQKNKLFQRLNIDLRNVEQIKFVQFDFTNSIKAENIIDKSINYQHHEIMTFIVGTFWYKDFIKDIPDNNLIIYPENVRVIRYDLFADLINLQGKERSEFMKIIELNKRNQIDNLIKLLRISDQNLHYSNELDLYKHYF